MEPRVIEFAVFPQIELMLEYAGIPLKVQKGQPARVKRYREAIEEMWEESKHLIRPKVLCQIFEYEIKNDQLLIHNQVFISPALVREIKKTNPPEVVLFVVTIGKEIVEKIDESPRLSARLYLGAIGSAATMTAVRQLCKILAKEKGHKKPFKYFFPGQTERNRIILPLSAQKTLFELLGREKIKEKLGVELNELACTMFPRKTFAGLAFEALNQGLTFTKGLLK